MNYTDKLIEDYIAEDKLAESIVEDKLEEQVESSVVEKKYTVTADSSDAEFGRDASDCYALVNVTSTNNSNDLWIVITGVSKDDLDLETTWDTWDDPGDYPSNAGGGPLPSYDYEVVESATLNIEPEYLDAGFEDYEGNVLGRAAAMARIGATEEEFDAIVVEAKKIGLEILNDIANDWAIDHSEDLVD